MPTVPHTLAQVSSSFLPGTEVAAWIDPLRDIREQSPPGEPVATGTVQTGGSLTFTGLQPSTRYVAYANGRVVQFTTGSVETSLEQLTDRVDTLEARIVRGSKTYDAPGLAAGSTATTTVTVVGSVVGAPALAGLTTLGADPRVRITAVAANGFATVRVHNDSPGSVDLASGTLTVCVFV